MLVPVLVERNLFLELIRLFVSLVCGLIDLFERILFFEEIEAFLLGANNEQMA